jgi:ABC-type transporter Mla MlaB component
MNKLDYFIHDGADAFRLKISGDLSGPAVASPDQAWRTGMSVLRGRPIIIDLADVRDADESGRDLLLHWHRIGARIIARTLESRVLAEGIVGVPIPMISRTSRKLHWPRIITAAWAAWQQLLPAGDRQ